MVQQLTLDSALGALINKGYYIIENFIDNPELADLNSEFEKIELTNDCKSYCQNGFLTDLYSNNYHLYPTINSLSKAILLTQIASQFFYYWLDDKEIQEIKDFKKVEVEHNFVAGPSNNSLWHFDRIPAIKFQIYLNDVTDANGSLKLQTSSHIATREYALKELRKNPNPLEINNYLKNQIEFSEFNIVSVEAPKGSLIIFDTMCLHSGGQLKSGYRKTLRFTANTPAVTAKYFRGSEFQSNPCFHHPFKHVKPDSINPKYLFVEA